MSDTPPDDKGPVPYERFAETRRELAALKTAAETATASLAQITAERDAAAREAAEAKAAATQHADALDRFRAAVGVGLTDPSVIEAAEWAWSRQPVEGRAPFGEALTAWRAEPAKAPAVLRPWFAPSAPPPSGAPPAPLARDPAPPAGQSPAPLTYSPDVIDRLIREGKYSQHREAIARELGGTARKG